MKTRYIFVPAVILAVIALLLGALALPASAGTVAVIDEATALARCLASYPEVSGPDAAFSLPVGYEGISAGEAQSYATGAGVKVGVIDGGLDFTIRIWLAPSMWISHARLSMTPPHGRSAGNC